MGLNSVIVHTAVSPLSWGQTRDWLVALSRSSLKEPETFTPTTSFILKAMTSSAAWELVSGSNFDNIFKRRFNSECLPQVNAARTLARRCRVETEAVVNRFQTLLTSRCHCKVGFAGEISRRNSSVHLATVCNSGSVRFQVRTVRSSQASTLVTL